MKRFLSKVCEFGGMCVIAMLAIWGIVQVGELIAERGARAVEGDMREAMPTQPDLKIDAGLLVTLSLSDGDEATLRFYVDDDGATKILQWETGEWVRIDIVYTDRIWVVWGKVAGRDMTLLGEHGMIAMLFLNGADMRVVPAWKSDRNVEGE